MKPRNTFKVELSALGQTNLKIIEHVTHLAVESKPCSGCIRSLLTMLTFERICGFMSAEPLRCRKAPVVSAYIGHLRRYKPMYVSTANRSMLEVLGFILRQQGRTRSENKGFACSSWLGHFEPLSQMSTARPERQDLSF